MSKLDHDRQIIKRLNDDQIEDEKAREMVKKLMTKNIMISTRAPAIMASSTNLLCDFFRERMEEDRESKKEFRKEVAMKVAEDWAIGAPTREVLLGWEVREGRSAYVMDMEKGGRWRKFDEEKGEIGLELEALVWDSLMEEILLDL